MLEKLDEISEKAEYLSSRTADLVTENRSLKSKIATLEEQLSEREGAYSRLSEQLEIVRMARSMEGKNGSEHAEEFKQKINAYIREIDQCLKLIGT